MQSPPINSRESTSTPKRSISGADIKAALDNLTNVIDLIVKWVDKVEVTLQNQKATGTPSHNDTPRRSKFDGSNRSPNSSETTPQRSKPILATILMVHYYGLFLGIS